MGIIILVFVFYQRFNSLPVVEKKHETLLSKEEFLIAEDLGDYFRIEADNRDLNYNKYFEVGRDKKIDEEYNSFNTKRLSRVSRSFA